jgi:hypothetical protein
MTWPDRLVSRDMRVAHVANIGARGRRRRLLGGAVWLVVGVIASAAMVMTHVRSAWYALLVIPFTLAALGYFQARDHT